VIICGQLCRENKIGHNPSCQGREWADGNNATSQLNAGHFSKNTPLSESPTQFLKVPL
jgi:hypothetical protein